MTRKDRTHGIGNRTGAPPSCGGAAGSATAPDREATTRPFLGRVDRTAIHQVTR